MGRAEAADAAHSRVILLGIVAVAISLFFRVLTLSQPLTEAHSFRQTQTAYTALIYHRVGIDLTQTPLPIFGPPWTVPFELPLFQAIAALLMDLGAPTEVALRSTSLFFFVVSMLLLYRLVALELDTRTAVLAVLAYGLSPLVLLWSRASLVETIAVAASIGCVFEAIRWDRTGGKLHFVLAIGIGVLASTIKITTAVVWLVPAILLMKRSRIATAAIVGSSFAAGIAWTWYADQIKAASPATRFLTSASLQTWNFGSLSQRLDPATWIACLGFVAGIGLLVVLAPFVARRSRLGIWALGTLLLGPLIFTNLYVVHDYYWMAVAPAGAIVIGIVARTLLSDGSPMVRRRSVFAVGVLTIASYVVYPRWTAMIGSPDPDRVLSQAADVRAASSALDLISINEGSWSPAVLFYADRRGYMEYTDNPPAPDGYVSFVCPEPGQPGPCMRVDRARKRRDVDERRVTGHQYAAHPVVSDGLPGDADDARVAAAGSRRERSVVGRVQVEAGRQRTDGAQGAR
jgi:hypothetical protein